MALWNATCLDGLAKAGIFTEIDLYLAGFLCRVAGRDDPDLALAAALAGLCMARGDVYADLERLDPEVVEGLAKAGLAVPEPRAWREKLARLAVIGEPGQYAPLILDGPRLYLERLFRAEDALARDLLRRAGTTFPPPDPGRLKDVLARLFAANDPRAQGPDMQQVAAFAALRKGLCVVTGGPGTGKTYTVARLLALLLALEGPGLRVGLAAPTGKAAARLGESLSQALDPALDAALGKEAGEVRLDPKAMTIHRLLGVTGDGAGFKHHGSNPLALDVLVVDEASMVDLPLMAALVEALPESARLVFLGDKDQLASVDPGAVMGDICGGRDLERFSPAFARDFARAARGAELPVVRDEIPLLLDCIVPLTHSYRFDPGQGIGAVSSAVRRGDGARALELLRAGQGGVSWLDLPPGRGGPAALEPLLVEGFEPLCRAATPLEGLERLDLFRVLTPTRVGRLGVDNLNRAARDALYRRGLLQEQGAAHSRMPLMILRNDYGLRLYNGDTGVVFRDQAGAARAYFPDQQGDARDLSLARLPEHQPVYAMTAHKSQGSEFTRLVLVLPPEATAGRELVYTALTRARQGAVLAGTPEALVRAVSQRMERRSGLGRKLWPTGREP